MSRWLRWGGLAAVFLVAGLQTACVGGDGEGEGDTGDGSGDATVAVALGKPHEFGIELSVPSAPAGEVTFEVTNGGSLPHQFAIVRHDGDPGSLPVTDVNVDAAQVEILADSGNMDPGATASIPLDLEPGGYVIFSNTGGHYTAGMYVGFTVE